MKTESVLTKSPILPQKSVSAVTNNNSAANIQGTPTQEKENSGWNFSPDPKSPAFSKNGISKEIVNKNGDDTAKKGIKVEGKFDQYRQQAEQKRKREEILKKETSNSRSSSPTGNLLEIKCILFLLRNA